MEINKLIKSIFWIFILLFLSISCKRSQEKNINFSNNSNSSIENKEQISQITAVSFVREFYSLYLIDLNENTDKCVLNEYLSEDLINSIEKLDYNPIINAQDYNKFDLRKLKISKTDNEYIYRVTFINMGKEIITDVKLTQKNNSFKIIELTNNQISLPYNQNKDTLSIIDENSYIFFSYIIDPFGDPRTRIKYTIEDFDNVTTIFKKDSYSDAFEYECTKQKKGNVLIFYYKTTIQGENYASNIPLIKIYKKGITYYATSPKIKNGKEIELKNINK